MYIMQGRCHNCLQNKKVLKLNSPDDIRGLCRKCLKEISEHPDLK